jgi:hypothetical protein
MPTVVRTSPAGGEIRVWPFCPTGVDADRITTRHGVLAAARFAHRKYSGVVVPRSGP